MGREDVRILIIEGNGDDMNAAMEAAGARTGSTLYRALLEPLVPGARFDGVAPADGDAALPAGTSLADYDGVVMGGSGLHVYDDIPAVTRQVDLVKAVLAAGVPFTGSCWAAQVATVAAGGVVGRSPNGREVGIARKVTLTPAGRDHPFYAGKAPVFDTIAIHYDEVTTVPPGAAVLATNGHSPVQALAFGTFWGVQYHPEYDLDQIARLMARYGGQMVADGFLADADAMADHAEDLIALHADPGRRDLAWRLGLDDDVLDPGRLRIECANWVTHALLPHRAETRR
ncbi:MAG: type 1 glutamine amidotransferase [Rhodobacterales bacterium]|nr:type 1 glutamine amidotransferase [Rhodobacterales bacterium]